MYQIKELGMKKEIKRLNESLNELELKNKLVLKASGIGIWRLNYETGSLVWDDQMYEIYGLERTTDQDLYSLWKNSLAPEDLEETEKAFNTAVQTNTDFNHSFWLVTPNGERRFIKAMGVNEYDPNGKAIGMMGTNQNVTQLKLAQLKYKSLFDIATDGIHILDENGDLMEFSRSFANMLGYPRDEIKKLNIKDWDDLVIKDRSINERPLFEAPEFIETRHKRKDGTVIDVQITTKTVQIEGEKYLYASSRDVTKLKEQEKQLEEQRKILTIQSKMLSMSRLLSNIAHHWRQPLNLIASAAIAIKFQKELGELDGKFVDEKVDSIIDGTQVLSNTIEKIKSFMEGSHSYERFELDQIVSQALDLEKLSLEKNNIRLIKNIEPEIKMYTSKEGLLQSLLNIINNSVDALKKTDKDKKYLRLDIYKKDDNLVIDIKDNAGGIEEENLTKVFDPYFTTCHQSFGKGMGLNTVYNMVTKNMNGQISVKNSEFTIDNKIYRGAFFKIVIPFNIESDLN